MGLRAELVLGCGEKRPAAVTIRTVTEADDVAVAIMGAVIYLRQTTGTTILVDSGKHL